MSHFHRLFHLNQFLSKKNWKFLSARLQSLIRVIYHCDISPQAQIDKSVWFCHSGFGIVVNPRAKIEANCLIQHSVTIGELSNGGGCPSIGKNVFIGAKATILGDVKIGDSVQIGAGAVVIKDVPANSTAVGVPARIISKKQ